MGIWEHGVIFSGNKRTRTSLRDLPHWPLGPRNGDRTYCCIDAVVFAYLYSLLSQA